MTLERDLARCPVCGGASEPPLFCLTVPVNCSAIHRARTEAEAARKETVSLTVCRSCGLIFNACFNPALLRYDNSYDNSLHFSQAFRVYCESLVSRLVGTYDLRGKTAVEIGCGQGDFLKAICQLGDNRGFGFDPACPDGLTSKNVSLSRSYYSAAHLHIRADAVFCRHVLEHIEDPKELLFTVRSNLMSSLSPVFYCEVPNAKAVLAGSGIWDIIYPHCNYFTAHALANTLSACQFRVLRLTTSFEDQYLSAEAVPASGGEVRNGVGELEGASTALQMLQQFSVRFHHAVEQWAAWIERALMKNQRLALWGIGAKAVTFLNTTPGAQNIPYLVDANPRKHGTFVPGTGQQVGDVASLAVHRPDAVILLNGAYQNEVSHALVELCPEAEVWICVDGLPSLADRSRLSREGSQNESGIRQPAY
jgi:hypothetical protein